MPLLGGLDTLLFLLRPLGLLVGKFLLEIVTELLVSATGMGQQVQ